MQNIEKPLTTEENINLNFFKWLFEKNDIVLYSEEDKKPKKDFKSDCLTIYYSQELKSFFETEPMQRLKRILQLGNFIDNDSNVLHTRYEHSIGVYNLKRSIILKQFLCNPNFRHYVEQNKLKKYLIAELIKSAGHDIGHLPLSHDLELSVIEKPGFHEKIGKRLLLENSSILNCLNNISEDMPDILKSVLENDYFGFKLLDEGNFDIDRFDYMYRDLAYRGQAQSIQTFPAFKLVPVDFENIYKGSKPKENKNGSILVSNNLGRNSFIPVFSIDLLPQIEEFLKLRLKCYSESYFHPITQIRDKSVCIVINKAIETNEPNGKALQDFLVKLKSYNDETDVNLDEWLSWNDLNFFDQLLDIAEFSENASLRKATSFAIPGLDGLFDMSVKMLSLKENNKKLSKFDKKFLQRLHRYLTTKGELIDNLKDFDYWDKCIKFTTNYDNIKKLSSSSIPIEYYSHKIVGYNLKEPIYFETHDGQIFSYDSLPNRPNAVSSKTVSSGVAFCVLPFLDESDLKNPDFKLLDGKNNYTFGTPYLNRPSPSPIYINKSYSEQEEK